MSNTFFQGVGNFSRVASPHLVTGLVTSTPGVKGSEIDAISLNCWDLP